MRNFLKKQSLGLCCLKQLWKKLKRVQQVEVSDTTMLIAFQMLVQKKPYKKTPVKVLPVSMRVLLFTLVLYNLLVKYLVFSLY